MGGQAFNKAGPAGESPITASRLSPEQYKQLRAQFIAVLQTYYERVICPLEAPAKTSHGDIDLLVETPKQRFSLADMSKPLGAERYVNRGDAASFAVPFTELGSEIAYAQLDVRPCPGNLDWLAFLHSYGDLWQILRTMIRRYGLTANDKGFYVRLAELEAKAWKASMLFLSNDPDQVLRFLHLDEDIYERGFESEDKLFEWICRSHMVDKAAFTSRPDTADDRRRLQTRVMYKHFIEDWVPTLPDRSSSTEQPHRDAILQEAVAFFGKTEQYALMAAQAQRAAEEDKVWVCFTGLLHSTGLSTDQSNLVIRGFKRWTEIENRTPYVRAQPEMDVGKQPWFGMMLNDNKDALDPAMSQWMMGNWENIKGLEKRRVKEAKNARSSEKIDHC